MVSESDDALEEWERDLMARDTFPLLAIAIGVVVVAVNALPFFFLMPIDLSLYQFATYGVAAIVAGVVWATAWALTLRKAGTNWMAAGAAILLVAAMLAAFVLISISTDAARQDATTLRKIRVNVRGEPVFLAADPHRGPLTMLGLRYIGDVLAERRRRDVEIGKAMRRSGDPAADCGHYALVKTEIAASDRRVADLAAKFRKALEAGIGDSGLRSETLGRFDSGWGAARGEIAEMTALRSRELDQLVPMCKIMARHNGMPFGLSGPEQEQARTISTALRDISVKENDLRARSINRINKKLEIAGDTRF